MVTLLAGPPRTMLSRGAPPCHDSVMDTSATLRRRRAVLAATVLLVAAGSFGLGLSVAGRSDAPPVLAASASSPAGPSLFLNASSGPRILLDPTRVLLLPDASLRLELPTSPDAGGSPPTEPRSR